MHETPIFDVSVKVAPYIGYPQAFNHIPFIETIRITPTRQTEPLDVIVEVRLQTMSGDVSAPLRVPVPALATELVYGPEQFERGRALEVTFDAPALQTLLALETIEPCTVEVTVTHGTQVVGRGVASLVVAPPRFWAWEYPRDKTSGNIAALALHYHPVIDDLVSVAVKWLQTEKKEVSLHGYQRDAASVDLQVEALYEAARSYQLTYVNSPANWEAKALMEGNGTAIQSIRTAEIVIAERAGNCIDLTLLLAAAIERIKLYPVVVLAQSHAVVGYWRKQRHLPEAVMTLADTMNYIDNDEIRLLESTFITRPVTFAQSCKHAHDWLTTPDILTEHRPVAVDIVYARLTHQVAAIPTRMKQASGETVILQAPTIEYRTAPLPVQPTTTARVATEDGVPARITQWKTQLLDLSLRNRLINFNLEQTSYIQIPMQQDALFLFEDLLTAKPLELKPYPTDDMYTVMQRYISERGDTASSPVDIKGLLAHGAVYAHVTPDRYTSVLRKIVRTAKNITEQSGVNQLYLALGSLVWTSESVETALQSARTLRAAQAEETGTPAVTDKAAQKNQIRSPLILVPVQVLATRAGKSFSITLDPTSPVMPNYSLIEKLRSELGFVLPGLEAPPHDDYGIDIQKLLSHVRSRVAEENYSFRVDETCVLGFFDFGNYRLWRDLGDNWQHYINRPLVHHMVHSPSKAFVAPTTTVPEAPRGDALASELPIPADGSQLEAIRRGLEKQTFVLQGPPGTGKSQTIANLIFASIRRGMSVLFVTEKSTAAQVVYDRLAAIKGDAEHGIETMVLDIHDQDSRPDAVKSQITRALNAVVYADNIGYDITKRRYETVIQQLQLYPQRLHAKGKFGFSLYSAHERFLALSGTESITIPAAFFNDYDREAFEAVLGILRKIQETAIHIGTAAGNPWVGLARVQSADQNAGQVEEELSARLKALSEAVANGQKYHAVQALTGLMRSYENIARIRALTDVNTDTLEMVRVHSLPGSINARRRIHTLLQTIREVDGTLVGKSQRNNDIVKAIFTQQEAYKQLRDEVKNYPGLKLPVAWDPQNSMHLGSLHAQLEAIDALLARQVNTDQSNAQELQTAIAACSASEKQTVYQLCSAILSFFELLGRGQDDIDAWSRGESVYQKLTGLFPALSRDVYEHDMLLYRRLSAFAADVGALEGYGLAQYSHDILNGRYRLEHIVEIFERSFFAEHTAQLLRTSVLDQFDATQHNANIAAFGEVSSELRTLISGIVSADILQKRQEYIEEHVDPVTELRRALQQIRRTVSVRQLLSKHNAVIRALMPCTIASPNSIAMLLDVPDASGSTAKPYDLVIFDEASQVRVTSAISGIGRADAAIIVGDSKQMPPTSIAEKSLVDENELYDDMSVIDEESILNECVLAQIPSHTLTWHYRSENELLIAFSNLAYYDGRLNAFPSPPHQPATDLPVRFERIQGQYIRATTDVAAYIQNNPTIFELGGGGKTYTNKTELLNTNPMEARAIFDHVVALTRNPATANCSIGIVTFNEKQADYLDMLLSSDANDSIVAERVRADYKDSTNRIFVKSLETIQGDEADIILFSVAFSRNEQGKLPMNFGPLNRVGGERRLNVAITRARKQVVVFCSFDPGELRVDETSARGMHDLHDYLVYAQKGPDAAEVIVSRRSYLDRHREQIAKKLRAAGCDVVTEVGLTDFKIDLVLTKKSAPHMAVGILLDGVRWSERTTVSDRDVFPKDILETRMRWSRVLRVWLPDWLRDEAGELQRIIRELDAVAESGSVIAAVNDRSAILSGTVQTPLVGLTDQEVTETSALGMWKPWQVRRLGDPIVLQNVRYMENLRVVHGFLREIIITEGPVSPRRLVTLIAAAFGVDVVTEKLHDEVIGIQIAGVSRDSEGFLYPPEISPKEYRSWRKTQLGHGAKRGVEDISRIELKNGILTQFVEGSPATLEQILIGMRTELGAAFLTERIIMRILDIISECLADGTLVLTADDRYIHAVSESV